MPTGLATLKFKVVVSELQPRYFYAVVDDFPGGYTEGVTPVPIPNTEVKPTEVDGTVVTRPWESRTLPVIL